MIMLRLKQLVYENYVVVVMRMFDRNLYEMDLCLPKVNVWYKMLNIDDDVVVLILFHVRDFVDDKIVEEL